MRSAEQADEPAFDLGPSQPAAADRPGRASRTHPSIVHRIFAALGVLLALLLAYLLFWPVPIEPYAWHPGVDPAFLGPYAENDDLARAATIAIDIGAGAAGPETVAQSPRDGLLYTGLVDGWVVRIDPRTEPPRVSRFAFTGGRPLGIAFDAQGVLHVAHAERGILRITEDGRVSEVTGCGSGKVPGYTDSLAIAANGTIWFTCPSQRWSLDDIHLDALETRPTGRLMSYDPRTGRRKRRLRHLMFANGVVFGPGERYVLVNEWYGYRIVRLWLRGPRRGRHDVFVDNLPGYPDNLSIDRDGTIWVGLVIPRNAGLDRLLPHPFLRKILPRIPARLQPQAADFAWILGLDADGRVVHNLQEPSGRFPQATGAVRTGDELYVSSNVSAKLLRLPVPGPLPR